MKVLLIKLFILSLCDDLFSAVRVRVMFSRGLFVISTWSSIFTLQESKALTIKNSLTPPYSTIICDRYEVNRMSLIGAGGTGDVYSAKARVTMPSKLASNLASIDTAFKIGKIGSSERLINECTILQYLDSKGYLISTQHIL